MISFPVHLYTHHFPHLQHDRNEWILPYGWGSEFLIAGGCYRNAKWDAMSCVCWCCDWHTFPGQGKEEVTVSDVGRRAQQTFSNQTKAATFCWLLAPRRVCQISIEGTAPSFPFHTSASLLWLCASQEFSTCPGCWSMHRKVALWRAAKSGWGVRRFVFPARKSFQWLHETVCRAIGSDPLLGLCTSGWHQGFGASDTSCGLEQTLWCPTGKTFQVIIIFCWILWEHQRDWNSSQTHCAHRKAPLWITNLQHLLNTRAQPHPPSLQCF